MDRFRRRNSKERLAKIICFLCFSYFTVISSESEIVYVNVEPNAFIGGIFSSSKSAPYLAAKMALNDVEGHYEVETLPYFNDTFQVAECEDEETIRTMMTSASDVRIWLAGCQQDCLTMAEITQLHNKTNVIILCYGITTLPFEEGLQYKNLFTIEPNAYSIAHTYAKFILRCKWNHIAVLYQNEPSNDYTKIANNLKGSLEVADVNIEVYPFIIEYDTLEAVNFLESKDPSIIVCLSDAATARRILCNSYAKKLYGEKYVWMFPGSTTYGFEWYKPKEYEDLGCSTEIMEEVANDHFIAKTLNWNYGLNITTTSGRTVASFKSQLHRDLETVGEPIKFDYYEAALAYDAIWASVLGVRAAIEEHEKLGDKYTVANYGDLRIIMDKVTFVGISGNFSFNNDRGRSITNSVVKMELFKNGAYEIFGHHVFTQNQWLFHSEQFESCKVLPARQHPIDPTIKPSSSISTAVNNVIMVLALTWNAFL